MSEQSEKVFNINDINARLQAIIHQETIGNSFWVSGMVKNVYEADSGYVYFNLVDDPFLIRCVVPKNMKGELAFTISNNIEAEVFGEIRFYDRRASIEINVQKIRLVESALVPPNPIDVDEYLQSKGLVGLSDYTKKTIPAEVKRIFLLTSSSSKALDDFKYTYTRKAESQKSAQIIHEDIPLKGEYAPKQIAEVIQRVTAMSKSAM